MYDYTYLTNLEVDTRQTFSDISDDLALLNHNGDLEKSNAKTLISSWQKFFWESDNPDKQNLNVIFTDLFIDHGNKSNLDENEIMSVGELNELFGDLDANFSWCGKYTFDGLLNELTSAINTLNKILNNVDNIYPVGSMVISNVNPSFVLSKKWESKNSSYIAENLGNSGGVKLGFNDGKVEGKSVGSSLGNVIVKPSTTNKVPKHEHKLIFIPESGSGSGTAGPTTSDPLKTNSTPRPGLSKKAGLPYYSGYNTNDNSKNHTGLAVTRDANATREEGGEAVPSFTTSNAEVSPKIKSINVAPKTYPIPNKIWERVQ